MFPADTYRIYEATDDDRPALRRLAELDSASLPHGRMLVGEIDGTVAAAISLGDKRVIADPFKRTGGLAPILRMRAGALEAFERTPSLPDRLLAGIRMPRSAVA